MDPICNATFVSSGIEPIIALSPECWGQGLAGEAMTALTRYARNSLELSQLVAAVDEPNIARTG